MDLLKWFRGMPSDHQSCLRIVIPFIKMQRGLAELSRTWRQSPHQLRAQELSSCRDASADPPVTWPSWSRSTLRRPMLPRTPCTDWLRSLLQLPPVQLVLLPAYSIPSFPSGVPEDTPLKLLHVHSCLQSLFCEVNLQRLYSQLRKCG